MCNILQKLLTLFGGDSQAAFLMSFFSFHWVVFTNAFNLHCAVQYVEYGQHFAALSNTLGQLYPRPSEARSLSPLNLPNYASHQLSSHSIAVIPQPHTLMCCLSVSTFFFISVHPLLAFLGFYVSLLFLVLFLFYSPLHPPDPTLSVTSFSSHHLPLSLTNRPSSWSSGSHRQLPPLCSPLPQ